MRLTLLGDPAIIRARAAQLGLDVSAATVLDPHDADEGSVAHGLRRRFAREYAELRAHKGVTPEQAWDTVVDVSYFGTLMVLDGLADGMVSGRSTRRRTPSGRPSRSYGPCRARASSRR